MSITTIPYPETGYFSKLVCDYLAEKPELFSRKARVAIFLPSFS